MAQAAFGGLWLTALLIHDGLGLLPDEPVQFSAGGMVQIDQASILRLWCVSGSLSPQIRTVTTLSRD
jgi:hypothetical protein